MASLGWSRWRWSLYAPFYDLLATRAFRQPRRRSLACLELKPGERVLLVGAGTGLDLEVLPCVTGLELTAIDLSPAMLERLRQRSAGLDLTVDARTMDATRLEFPAARFDAVVAHLVLAVVPDAEAATREIARVLRPGGRVAILDKFLPDGATPSTGRRLANLAASLVATDLNRRLGPLLAAAGLTATYREPSLVGGLFVIAGATKPGAPRAPVSR